MSCLILIIEQEPVECKKLTGKEERRPLCLHLGTQVSGCHLCYPKVCLTKRFLRVFLEQKDGADGVSGGKNRGEDHRTGIHRLLDNGKIRFFFGFLQNSAPLGNRLLQIRTDFLSCVFFLVGPLVQMI